MKKRTWTFEQKMAAVARLEQEPATKIQKDLKISSGQFHSWKMLVAKKESKKRKSASLKTPNTKEALVFLSHARKAFAPFRHKRGGDAVEALLTLATLTLEGRMP